MRRLSILIPILAIALAACSSGAAPGWTYAPAPSTTPAPSGGGSGAPGASGGASAAPSAAASAPASVAPSSAGSAAPSGGGSPVSSSGNSLTVTAPVGAATAGFEPTTLTAPANTAFNVIFDNQDNQAPHNLIFQDSTGANVQVSGDASFFQGPGQRQFGVPALAAGTYSYLCQVHPTTMKGTLTVQ